MNEVLDKYLPVEGPGVDRHDIAGKLFVFASPDSLGVSLKEVLQFMKTLFQTKEPRCSLVDRRTKVAPLDNFEALHGDSAESLARA